MSAKTLKKKNLKVTKRPAAKPSKSSSSSKGKRIAIPEPVRIPRVLKIVEDPRVKLGREQYEAAVGLLGQHKYDRAITLFEKVLAAPSAELVERARVHLSICRQRIERKAPAFKTAEDHYNYAVERSNSGKLEEAEEHLRKAMKLSPRAGHVYYALAAVLSLRRDNDGSLSNLRQAIDLDARNRFLARSDSDFHALYEDPRFADLVYPERLD